MKLDKGNHKDKMLATLRPVSLNTKSPLAEQAFNILTPFAFKKFQEGFERASQYLVVHFEGGEFIIRHSTAKIKKITRCFGMEV